MSSRAVTSRRRPSIRPVRLSLARPPARYLPFMSGRYEVAPGLFKFGRDFGNGAADGRVFQIDREFDRYQQVKRAARAEDLNRYSCVHELGDDVSLRVMQFIRERLASEHDLHLKRARTLDDIAQHVQEDLAIVSADGDRHWLSAIHLCFPNHWAAEEKIGRDFVTIHAPVAGIEPVNRRAGSLVRMMVNATEGLVRFAWGIATDDEPNHHPSHPPGRSFDPRHPRAFVRVERQTIWGFPHVGAALFTIRTYFLDCREIRTRPAERDALASAVRQMSPASLAYKGIAAWRDDLLAWLEMPHP